MIEIIATQTCAEEIRHTVVDDVEPKVTVQPGEQALHHPPHPARQEAPVPGAAGQDRDVDVVRKRRRGERRALDAAIAEQVALPAERGQARQHRQGARAVICCANTGVVRAGRAQFGVEQPAVPVAGGAELDPLDQLATVDASRSGPSGR